MVPTFKFYLTGFMNININDVAKLSNVSKATVSAVINNKVGVSEETREKVQGIIKKFNYRPSQVARSLSIKKTKTIGIVIKEIDNPYFARIMRGVFDICSNEGYTVLLGSSELSVSKEVKSLETLVSQRVDGLLVSGLHEESSDSAFISNLIRSNYPLVMLGGIKNFNTNVVTVNNVDAAYNAVTFLLKNGHKKIGYFSGPTNSLQNDDRKEGYRRAFADNDISFQKKYIYDVGSYLGEGYQHGKEIFSSSADKPTAVFCYNDLVAIGLINSLLDLQIRVPEDVAVVGFDDIDFAKYAKTPLTTIHNPAYEVGVAAAELLIKQINQKEKPLTEKVVLGTYLIKRNSA